MALRRSRVRAPPGPPKTYPCHSRPQPCCGYDTKNNRFSVLSQPTCPTSLLDDEEAPYGLELFRRSSKSNPPMNTTATSRSKLPDEAAKLQPEPPVVPGVAVGLDKGEVVGVGVGGVDPGESERPMASVMSTTTGGSIWGESETPMASVMSTTTGGSIWGESETPMASVMSTTTGA